VRWGRVLGIVVVTGALLAPRASAADPPPPDPTDIATALVRQACAVTWVAELCAPAAYPDPGYVATSEPHADQPLQSLIGVEHDHSGYSDGDPTARPADYYAAAKTGHNRADAGGDTGVVVDFMLSSDHSENEKLPVTTSEACFTDPLSCAPVLDGDQYRKWEATLEQANAATDRTGDAFTGFTALRGFEFTNDYFNHLGVYLSRNVVNAKVDGSYVTTEAFWNWLRRPADEGGGSDALVVFNHPGHDPQLSPFDGGTPTGPILQSTLGGANWHDYAYVPDVDDRVSAMEVNSGNTLPYFLKALRNGWHIGPVMNEDEHEREWSSTEKGKTVLLTRGRSPQDYYWALQHGRTIAMGADVITGTPGHPAVHPTVEYWADAADMDDPGAAILGATATGPSHELHLQATGLEPGSRAVLLAADPASTPTPLGVAGPDGSIGTTATVSAPTTGTDWRLVVICGPDSTACGTDARYDVVTAPIWFAAAASAPVAAVDASATGPSSAPLPGTIPATGWSLPAVAPVCLLGALLLLSRRRAWSG
jgi:hypothetical protein